MKDINEYLLRVERYLFDGDTIIISDYGEGSSGDRYLTVEMWEYLNENYTPNIRSISNFEDDYDISIKEFYSAYNFLDPKDIECFLRFDHYEYDYSIYVPVYNY